MNHQPGPHLRTLIPWAALLAASLVSATAQVTAPTVTRSQNTTTLEWTGGHGPFVIETSQDGVVWSAQGDPVPTRTISLPGFASSALYRVTDLDPDARHGTFIGQILTDQGEFGELFSRHRLKTRLWLYTTKNVPHTSPSFTAADYFLKLIVVRQYLESGRVRTWTGPLESLGTIAKPTSSKITIRWTEDDGADQRAFTLSLDFPYSHAATRTAAPLASDPDYTLACSYATPQPELDFDGTYLFVSRKTTSESTALYQLDPANGSGPFPPPRQYTIRHRGAEVSLHFIEGLPLIQGDPPFIWKTFILDRWLSPTTAGGGSLPPFSTDSWFARTLRPGHHNFVEYVLIEPGLDPALSEATRAALAAANIRYVYTFKDLDIGTNSQEILYIGYDDSMRTP